MCFGYRHCECKCYECKHYQCKTDLQEIVRCYTCYACYTWCCCCLPSHKASILRRLVRHVHPGNWASQWGAHTATLDIEWLVSCMLIECALVRGALVMVLVMAMVAANESLLLVAAKAV